MYLSAKYLMCNTRRVKQKDFFPNHIKLCFYFLTNYVVFGRCFSIKNVFRQSKMAAIKTLTDANIIFKKGYYMHLVISTQINHI